jgi:PAS domain S-box-containing protein
MWMLWGPELTFLCNDAYRPTLGVKDAWALGKRSDKVWEEIWADIGPRIDRVLRTGESTWDEALLLFLERSGFREETYHTFSYSPLADDDGAIVGMLCVVTEETERVIGERRLRLLRELGVRLADAKTSADIWGAVEACLAAEPHDLTWATAYLPDSEGTRALRVSSTHPVGDYPAIPAEIDLNGACKWPLRKLFTSASGAIACRIGAEHGPLPKGPWDRSSPQALAVAIPSTQGSQPTAGAFIVGLNPYRPLDAAFRGFIDLVVGQIGASLASVNALEAERARAEALMELDRAKTTFFSNISHEFRTPLTLMLGPLEDLLSGAPNTLTADEKRQISLAYRNGTRLLRLVNALLDFARMEAGRAQAMFQATDLASFTADLASSFRSATDKAGLSLIIDCPPLSAPAYVDRDMWEKIVLNLISNAFKFTFDGEIEVVLREVAGVCRLTVRDTGTGIPAEEIPRLFERFHRVEGARGRSFEGSGIGLALVQELVKLHGGAISATSDTGVGSTFVVTLPIGSAHLPQDRLRADLAVAAPPPMGRSYVEEALRWDPGSTFDLVNEPPVPADGEEVSRAHGHIVLADDNADLRDYISRLLMQRGYTVDTVADGIEALAALDLKRPDLIISDVMMPRLDGFGLLRAIRKQPALRDLPIIMLSARAGEEAKITGLHTGADDYLTKPFSARELLARVAANLDLSRIRREVNAALYESEARFRNMADHAPFMMWVTDESGGCTYVNRAWSEFTGRGESDARGGGWLEVVHPDDRGHVDHAFKRAHAARDALEIEYRLMRHDGAYRWVIGAASPRFDDTARYLGHIGSMIDITERKDHETTLARRVTDEVAARAGAEDALRQAQKMEAVGQLTGGLAHDFNNLLAGITGSLDLLGRRLAQGRLEDMDRYIGAAQEAASRAAALTHRLLAFSRRQTLDPRPTDINRLVWDLADLIRRTVGPGIELDVLGAPDLWNTLIDPHQLENAVLNLCINARDAMPDGGRITIETSNKDFDEGAAAERELQPGAYIALCVTDTGTGMTPDTMRRAFDPFFTTKPLGQGTGLGLSMIYGFAIQSGGSVKIESRVGHGTTICIYLPRHHGEASRPANLPHRPNDTPNSNGETVLMVDDEPTVRMLISDVLKELGYNALESADSGGGLKILQSNARVDLLITDVGLPGRLNGRQLADAARAARPDLKVLFITGYAENAVLGNGRLEDGMHITTKPFAMDGLARQIREILEGRA